MKERARGGTATIAVLVLLVAAGCSDSGSSGSLSPEAFVAQYNALTCEQLRPCCDADQHPFDESWCLQGRHFGVPPPEYRFVYDADAARHCLEEKRVARDTCGHGDRTLEPSCYQVIRPAAELGSTCLVTDECIPPDDGSPVRCIATGPGAESVCAVVGTSERGVAGEPCGRTCLTVQGQEYCSEQFAAAAGCYESDGLYCSPTTARCVRLGGLGDACVLEGFSTCGDAFYCETCDDASGCAEGGTCQPRVAPGEPCEGPAFDGCGEDGFCEEQGCSSPAFAPGGDPTCDYRCIAPGDEGEPCDPTSFASHACVTPLFCDLETSTCRRPLPAGSPCNGSSSCDSGLICDPDDEVCRAQRGVGDPCTYRIQCITYRCSADPDDADLGTRASDGTAGMCLEPSRTDAYDCARPPEQTPSASSSLASRR